MSHEPVLVPLLEDSEDHAELEVRRSPTARRLFVTAALIAAGSMGPMPSPAAAAAETKKQALRLGVIAEQANEPDRMLRVYADLLNELRTRLAARSIEVAPLVIAKDLAELSRRVAHADVDLVIETVFATLDAQDQSRALVPALAIVRRKEREYHSVFFASRNSGIKSIDELRGRTLVLQAERSTTAFAVPRAELLRRGIDLVPAGQPAPPKGSASYVLAGAELNQAIWVLNGKGDAGAFNEGDWARLPKKIRDGLVVFHETRPILRGLLSFRTGLDHKLRVACEEVLLGLDGDPSGQVALAKASGITRFERLTAGDLASLKEWKLALRTGRGRP